MSNITDKNFKSNNSEVMRNKQIEEIAKVLCADCGDGCSNCVFANWSPCNAKALAEKLYTAGYRKEDRQ